MENDQATLTRPQKSKCSHLKLDWVKNQDKSQSKIKN